MNGPGLDIAERTSSGDGSEDERWGVRRPENHDRPGVKSGLGIAEGARKGLGPTMNSGADRAFSPSVRRPAGSEDRDWGIEEGSGADRAFLL